MYLRKVFFIIFLSLSFNSQSKAMFIVENIIKAFLNPNQLLLVNATENYTEGIKEAIENGADINTQNAELRTAIHLVIWHKNIEALQILLENGINIKIREEDGHTALHVSASVNSPRATQLLVLKSEYDPDYINEKNNEGNTPLHLAALQNSWQAATVLIEAGAKINIKNNAGKTPLHFAIIRKGGRIIKLLIKSGAKINIKDKNGRTPWWYSNEEIKNFIRNINEKIKRQRAEAELEKRLQQLEIQREKRERIIKEEEEERQKQLESITTIQSQLKSHLEQKRFNQTKRAVSTIQNQLRTISARHDYEELKHMTFMETDQEYRIKTIQRNFLSEFDNFLQTINGPIIKLPTKKELLKTFEQILFMQRISTGEIFEEQTSIRNLIGNFRDTNGNTALHLFAKYDRHRFIPVLILNGANINGLNNHQETPLHLATEFNSIQAATALIYFGANPNTQSHRLVEDTKIGRYTESQTPLTLSVERNCKEIFLILINLKTIDLNIQTKPYNETALHMAISTHNTVFIKKLFKAGTDTESRTYSSSKFPSGATAQDIAISKRQYAPELYACFNAEFAEKRRNEFETSLIINTPKKSFNSEEINNFLEWLHENNNVNFPKIKDKRRNNVFHYMAKYNNPQLIKLIEVFLDINVNLNAKNKRGFTPLQIALLYGNTEIAKAFFYYGAAIIAP